MTHPLYIELLTMTDDPNGKAAVNLAANGNLTPEHRKAYCKSTRSQFFPAKPAGMRYARHSFWQQVEAKFIWEIAWGVLKATDERKTRLAEWLLERRKDGVRWGEWPRKATFQPVAELPELRDGNGGANGWTPRAGKE